MKRSIQDIPIALIGAGNLATNLGKTLYHNGFRIVQVYSRTEEAAAMLASAVEAEYTADLAAVTHEASLYIVALKDSALAEVLPRLVKGREDALWVHTAGSISIDIWQLTTATRAGVFYPMQTFSKQREVDFREIPLFVEATDEKDAELLTHLANTLSQKVYRASSEQRKSLHLAAVFTCNFTNHMYALAADLLRKYNLPFDVMLPLIDETARKVHEIAPAEAQTGPAARGDENVMAMHRAMLDDEPQLQKVYRLLSESVENYKLNSKS